MVVEWFHYSVLVHLMDFLFLYAVFALAHVHQALSCRMFVDDSVVVVAVVGIPNSQYSSSEPQIVLLVLEHMCLILGHLFGCVNDD